MITINNKFQKGEHVEYIVVDQYSLDIIKKKGVIAGYQYCQHDLLKDTAGEPVKELLKYAIVSEKDYAYYVKGDTASIHFEWVEETNIEKSYKIEN